MSWTTCISGGPRRVNHAAVLLKDKIYSFGGYCSGADFDVRTSIDIQLFDTKTLCWNFLATPNQSPSNVPYQRYGHTVVSYAEKAYLFGGRNDCDGACNKVFEYDPVSATWALIPAASSFAPRPRDGHSACVSGDEMLIFGGFEEDAARFSNEVYTFNFSTRTWSEKRTCGDTPSWRDFHSATIIGHNMYVFGGRSDASGEKFSNCEVYDDSLYYLDLTSNRWHKPATSGVRPAARRSHSAFVYNGYLCIFGGYNGAEGRHYNSLHKFDPATAFWSEIHTQGSGPSPRRRQCCVVERDRAFLFGGTSPNEIRNADVNEEEDLFDHDDLYILDFGSAADGN